MATPDQIVARLLLRWENEEITLNDLVPALQRNGWNKADVYDWLVTGRRPTASWKKQFHHG